MTNKKNGFLTFIFSLLPGAGEMYMGFYKHGISLMVLFFAACVLSGIFASGIIVLLIPVVWFYSFFRVHNLNSLSDEQFYAIEDKFIFEDYSSEGQIFSQKRNRRILAVVLIVLGIAGLWQTMIGYILDFARSLNIDLTWLFVITHEIPAVLFAIGLILFGIFLIKGKKKEIDAEEGDTDGENRDN